jgi:hypothetical protein
MTHRRSLLVAAALAVAFAATSSADHSWGGYHWRSDNGIALNVGDNVSSAWDAYLTGALSDWNQSTYVQLTKVAGGTRPKNCKATPGRIEACSERYGFNGWLGIAQIWLSGGHIVQATTKLNDSYFNSATYNKPEWRRLVTCQEIAHDFGLDHQDENFNNTNLGTCMDYTNNPLGPPSNEHPNKHDYDELQIIYSHVDAPQTIEQRMPPAMGQINFEGPEQWGQLVRTSTNGRVQIYELDFGHGNKVITHVFWADPEGDARAGR